MVIATPTFLLAQALELGNPGLLLDALNQLLRLFIDFFIL
jgi:hypothetical protein